MTTTLSFKVMTNDQAYRFELAKEHCNWTNFYKLLVETLSLSDGTTKVPLYYYDHDNNKLQVLGESDFDVLLLEAENTAQNVVRLYYGDDFDHSASADWVFAPELNADVPSSTMTASVYATCFEKLGHVVEKHRVLIESNMHLRMLTSRFAGTLAVNPDVRMVPLFDQWLDSYVKNNDNNAETPSDNDKSEKQHDSEQPTSNRRNNDHHHRHRHHHHHRRHGRDGISRHTRREFAASIPDDIAQFLMSRPYDHHHRHQFGHHHHHPFGHQHHQGPYEYPQHPWTSNHHQQFPASPHFPGLLSSFFGGGKHKHLHHHHHHHQQHRSAFGPSPGYHYDAALPTDSDADKCQKGKHTSNAHPASFCGPRGFGFGIGEMSECRRPGGVPMMNPWFDLHANKAAYKKEMRRHFRGMKKTDDIATTTTSDSSDTSSSSDSDIEEKNRLNVFGSKCEEKKFWKCFAREHHGRLRARHRGSHRGGYHHNSHSGMEPFTPSHPPPSFIEQSFGQMQLGNPKGQ